MDYWFPKLLKFLYVILLTKRERTIEAKCRSFFRMSFDLFRIFVLPSHAVFFPIQHWQGRQLGLVVDILVEVSAGHGCRGWKKNWNHFVVLATAGWDDRVVVVQHEIAQVVLLNTGESSEEKKNDLAWLLVKFSLLRVYSIMS